MNRRCLFAAVALASSLAAGAQAQPMPPQLTYVQPLSPSGVQAVQGQLRQSGDYRGMVDGIWGPDSVVALQNFQQTHGLQVTGQLNGPTVVALGLDTNTLVGAPNAAYAFPPPGWTPSPNAVATVQGRLIQLGFYRGPRDGIWGPDTQGSIARFQQSRGLEPNSQLNQATIAALGLPPEVLAVR